ncbi:MAG: thiamine phosphate synthase [Hyphomicrobiales bacterium]
MKKILISPPDPFLDEVQVVNRLFSEGLEYFHVRKPDYNEQNLREYIEAVSIEFRDRLILHQMYELVEEYQLKGYHIKGNTKLSDRDKILSSAFFKSVACHTFEEVLSISKEVDYCFLSPVFLSISKKSYKPVYSIEDFKLFFKEHTYINNCIALGGICKENVNLLKSIGFSGYALLGSVWQNNNSMDQICENFLTYNVI